jgi:hypothetical protein
MLAVGGEQSQLHRAAIGHHEATVGKSHHAADLSKAIRCVRRVTEREDRIGAEMQSLILAPGGPCVLDDGHAGAWRRLRDGGLRAQRRDHGHGKRALHD